MYLCEGVVVVVVVYLNSLCIQCLRMWREGDGLYLLSVYLCGVVVVVVVYIYSMSRLCVLM